MLGFLILVLVGLAAVGAPLGLAWQPGPGNAPVAATAAEGPVPVRVLMPAPFVDATASLAARFNASHPGIRIELSRGPLDTEALSDLAVSSLVLGEAPYDVLMMDVSWTPKYAAAGFLEPLEPWLGDHALDPMLPGARAGNAFGGHLWRMPFSGDTALLYWRTDLMEAPPADTEALVRTARSLQKQGKVRWGYVWQGRQYEGLSCVMLEVLHGFGGRWWNPATERTELDTAAARQATGWLSMLVRSGVTPPAVANFAENEALQLFAAGEAAFPRNWPYAWKLIEQEGGPVADHVGVSPLPAAPGQAGGATLGTWGFSLPAHSPHPAEAVEVIRWLSGPEAQKELVLSQGYAPTWQSLYDDPDLQRRHPLLAVQRQSLELGALVRPLTPLYAQYSDVLQRQVNGVLSGSRSVELAMAEAQSQSTRVADAIDPR